MKRILRSLTEKKQLMTLVVSLLLWAVTFYTDTKIFSKDALNMNCLPIDTAMVPFMHITSKLLVLVCIYLFLSFLLYAWKRPRLLIPFLILMVIYCAGLIFTYPGYYMNDDAIIFAYATRYYPVYWHNYLTSLFYMTALSLFPASCGPVLLSDTLYALTYAYLFYRADRIYKSRWCLLTLIAGVLPFTLLGALMCFRPAIYASFFLFYFIYLFLEHKERAACGNAKLFLLALLTAVLALWRSESIILLPIGFILIALTYHSGSFFSKQTLKRAGTFLLLSCVLFVLIKMPQSHGEKTYYGSDYLIISTTRPLSVIVHREQTYDGAQEDLANVSAVTEFGYLHNDSLSCGSYNRYNSDHNEGRYTQTGASDTVQKAYLKSAMRLIFHNLDLYFGERIQLFCVTNGIYNYPSELVLNLSPVTSSDFHLYDHDKNYGQTMLEAFLRFPFSYHADYAVYLFEHGGEAYLPMLFLLFAGMLYTAIRKNWFSFFCFLALLGREIVIFLTAPASFIQYSYPMMYVTAAFLLLLLTDALCGRPAKKRFSSQTEEMTKPESV